jgi:hypothetical protein
MSLWARVKAAFKRLDGGHIGPGEIFDHRTYRGTFFSLLFWCTVTYLGWHFDEIFAWYRSIRGAPYEIDLAKQSWAQLWALIIGGIGIASSIIMMIMIPIDRRRARKSAKGQWYDIPELSNRDFELDDRQKTPDGE